MTEWLLSTWYWVSGPVILGINLLATAHVILRKRDTLAAIGWVGLIWLVPGFGSILYYLFGINRIARKARRLKVRRRPVKGPDVGPGDAFELPQEAAHLAPLARLVGGVTGSPLLPGNEIRPLHPGNVAYAEMLAAIDAAERSVGLSTYIFDRDAAGNRFIAAMARAVARGVDVRVVIDDVGAQYSWPLSAVGPLRRAGVRVVRFLPQLVPWHYAYANLRNHRKILIVDGTVGFTGGMNVRAAHDSTLNPRRPIADLHFRVEGPVVSQLRQTFGDDWEFCSGDRLPADAWFPHLSARGSAPARGIRGGPDDEFERIRAVCLGGLAAARESIRIVTPYFLPDAALVGGLDGAALRGVAVDVVLPAKNNLRLVQWACTGQLGMMPDHRFRVWLSPPPFDHTKLMIVDRTWVLFGSSNWDPRSMRLNFEFDVECYDPGLAGSLHDRVAATIRHGRRLTAAELAGRNLLVKLRDGAARLLTPYL